MVSRRDDSRERGEPSWGYGANRYTVRQRGGPVERPSLWPDREPWRFVSTDARGDYGEPVGGTPYGAFEPPSQEFGPGWRDEVSDLRRHARESREGIRRGFRGRGPKNYIRSDDRIAEDLSWALTEAIDVDASAIEITVSNGEVHLRGSVVTRDERARADELAQNILGVKHVINELNVRRPDLKGIRLSG
jgi:hypothetical protein